jgi:branched-chain amino acid transport system ATP-binding protein
MPALLECRDLDVSYGAVEAVHGVDLSVPERSIVAMLGANGSGKTTTLRAVSGMVAPRGGEIRFDGGRIDGLAANRVARLGICHVPEGRGIFPRLTVRDNLKLFAGAAGASENGAALHRVLERFPLLRDRLEQQAGTLSGGEQQMLALSRALVARPRLLLLDEVSMGLAPKVVTALFDEIAAFAESGITILLVEQYVRDALRLANYVYVLAKGRVVFVGEPDDFDEAELTSAYLGGN